MAKNIPIFRRRLLPHIYPVGASFFITFRLNDSLPQHIIKKLKVSLEKDISKITEKDPLLKEEKIYLLRKKHFGRFDYQLDKLPYGECHLKDIRVAKILADKIESYNGMHYDLKCYSIMPNHVHLVVDTQLQIEGKIIENKLPDGYVQVDKWMQLIKGGSSFLINKHLGRSGRLWQPESYDHYIRNEKEYYNFSNYTIRNPEKAGLSGKYKRPPYQFHRR